MDRAVIWHDIENGSYSADLPLWRALARETGGPILDLGAGTGRVARALHAEGHTVRALDSDVELLTVLRERSPDIEVSTADARDFELDERFALILAPMQLVQIVGGSAARVAMLERVRRHLLPDGRFAAALADPYDALTEEDRSPPYPDMIEREGWVFSSQPVWVREEPGRVIVERHRQAVSPDGALEEELAPFALDLVSVDEFEDEARAAGLEPVIRHPVPETRDHIGGAVVVCRR
ncbi:MAG TPA: class I SAM-dependent methyltransferase [Thermoleophilaceae bacterium]|nr:class I SAM-dependent methyltransferase [Thermoleophilaceae bacterium]